MTQVISPTAQDSTASFVLVAGSVLNTYKYTTVSYTIQNSGTNSINWKVLGGNLSDLSDGTAVKSSAAVVANAFDTYAVSPAPYLFYGVFIDDASSGSHGTANVHGVAKGD
jgi:uncharacterized membrane protein